MFGRLTPAPIPMRIRNTSLAPISLGALCALLPLTACQSNETEFDPEKQLELYMTTATYLYQDESLIRAQDQAVKALEIEPENRPMRRMIGWIRLRMGTIEDVLIAEEFFRDLYEDGDEDAPVLLGLATAQERIGIANDEASRAIISGERYTDHPDPEERAAELADEARRLWSESLANYQRVLDSTTQKSNALNGLLRVSALTGDYEASLNHGRNLLEISRSELEGWSSTLHSSELTETEERVARESVRATTDLLIETHLFRTSILHRLGRTGDALDDVEAAIILDATRADLYSTRAQLNSEVGLFAEAIEDLDKFLRLSTHPFEHPDVRRAYDLRAFCETHLVDQAAASGG